MKNKISKRLRDKELYVFFGTDIPPLNGGEFSLYGALIERSEKNQSLIYSYDEIFDGYTYTKKERFLVTSRLIKKKVISVDRVSYSKFKFTLLPKISFRQCTEGRIYHNLTHEGKRKLKEELKHMIK